MLGQEKEDRGQTTEDRLEMDKLKEEIAALIDQL